jgi:hypothetical protein
MTNEEINKIIAKFRGWVEYHPTPESISKGYPSYSYWIPPRDSKQFAENWGKLEMDYPPDYCNNLNAMHEAENTIKDPIQQSFYAEYLGDCGSFEKGEYPTFRFVNSTAKERAIAFVKIIRKWKD